MNRIKVAVAQQRSNDSEIDNFTQIQNLLNHIVHQDVDIVCFPENSLFFQIVPEVCSSLTLEAKEIKDLESWSHDHGVGILLGGVPLKTADKYINTTIWIEPGARAQIVYQKIHLFDVKVGDFSFEESFNFRAGNRTAILEYKGWRFGLSICYDLRFAELYYLYGKQDVDVLFVPSAFTFETGKAHWHPLLRARAIENQVYVVAPAQSGRHLNTAGEGKRTTYGHSLVVNPWGEVITDLGEVSPCIEVVQLSKSEIEQVRKRMPIKSHRRLEFNYHEK